MLFKFVLHNTFYFRGSFNFYYGQRRDGFFLSFFLRWFLNASVIIGVLGHWELCSRQSANHLCALSHIILRISLRGMCFKCPHSLYRLGKPMLRDVEPCSASPCSECWGRNSRSCSFHNRACALSHVDKMPSQPGCHLQIFFFILSAVFSTFWVEECFHNSGGGFLCFSCISVDSVSPYVRRVSSPGSPFLSTSWLMA